MSKLTKEELLAVAALARIEVADDHAMKLAEQMSSILTFVDYIQSADTTGVEPVSQVTGLQDVWREDEVVDCAISQADLLQNAPATQDGYVKVKKVL